MTINVCSYKLYISWLHAPSCSSEFIWMKRFSFASPFSWLLTHSTVVLLSSFTVSMTVLLIVLYAALVITWKLVWFSKRGHLMVGKGTPWLIHTQVRTAAWTTHLDPFRIFANPENKQHHNITANMHTAAGLWTQHTYDCKSLLTSHSYVDICCQSCDLMISCTHVTSRMFYCHIWDDKRASPGVIDEVNISLQACVWTVYSPC